jgi:hypothetical protein
MALSCVSSWLISICRLYVFEAVRDMDPELVNEFLDLLDQQDL